MNPLFPVSIAVSTVIVIPLWQSAMAPGASPFHVASQCLLGTLLSLAILEHWFLVLPLPSEALWKWGLRSRSAVTVAVPAEAPRVVVPLAPRGAAE
jgi:putative photosynthetic complex assembly protein 2